MLFLMQTLRKCREHKKQEYRTYRAGTYEKNRHYYPFSHA
jgi:hypothetical protein